MNDNLKSDESFSTHEHVEFPDFDKFEDDVSGWKLFDLDTEKLKIDFERFSPLFVTEATLTPAYPHNGSEKGLSFSNPIFVNSTPRDGGNEREDGSYARFSNEENGNKRKPNIYVFYQDEYTGEYIVKLYLLLWDSGPYEFSLMSKQKKTTRRLVGPGNKVITLRIKNPDHVHCVLEQLPIDNDIMRQWRFYKAVIGRPLLSLKEITR